MGERIVADSVSPELAAALGQVLMAQLEERVQRAHREIDERIAKAWARMQEQNAALARAEARLAEIQADSKEAGPAAVAELRESVKSLQRRSDRHAEHLAGLQDRITKMAR